MLALGIIMLVVGILGFMVMAIYYDDDERVGIYWLLGVIAVFGLAIVITSGPDHTSDYSLKEYNLKTEVRQEYLNGQEISVDTVYIFTPKKK